ncbi:MAG: type II toxin-antitoxin system VapC family toxin [Lewinellaceae bacterium]|jgi:PIN domain nuclease of toxin-antitoxin system|nr:type II toxin-antitoxin system VapC family toxin [Lewinellaceae bacterium]
MRLLLDSHTTIWYLQGDNALSADARRLIADADNDKFISAASVWEISIKVSLGKIHLGFPFVDFYSLLDINNFEWVPITFSHLVQSSQLPFHHRDPFDRIMIAQALAEDMAVVGRDPAFPVYGVPVLW